MNHTTRPASRERADSAAPAGASGRLDRFWDPGLRAWPPALLAGAAAFALYAVTASPYVVPHFDTAEAQTLAATGGIAHSGYPTFVLLLRLLAQLPWGTLAWRANLLSALAGGVAVGALAYAAMRLTRRAGAAVPGALAFALSYEAWSESAQAGVHAPTLAVGAIAFLVTLRFLYRPSTALALGLGALCGLGLTLHVTIVALAFPVAWMLWLAVRARALRAGHVLALAVGLAAGLAPFTYSLAQDVPGRRMNYMNDTYGPENGPRTAWGPGPGPRAARLAWLLSGRQYLKERSYGVRALPRTAATVAIDAAVNEFPLPSLLAAAAGFALLAAAGGAVGSLALAWMLGAIATTLRGGTGATGPYFFLPGDWLLGLGLAVALAWLARAWRPAPAVALGLVLALLPLARLALPDPVPPLGRWTMTSSLWRRWPAEWSPFRHDARYDAAGRTALAALPRDAIVLGYWDRTCVLRYLVWGEGLRPDVDVRFAPSSDGARFRRLWREAAATGRPVFLSNVPEPGALDGGTAVRVHGDAWCPLWRLQLAPGQVAR